AGPQGQCAARQLHQREGHRAGTRARARGRAEGDRGGRGADRRAEEAPRRAEPGRENHRHRPEGAGRPARRQAQGDGQHQREVRRRQEALHRNHQAGKVTMKLIAAALAAGFILAPLAAEAQSYRCTGKDGKKYYGQAVPPQCLGQPVEELNAQGMVVKRFDAAASAAEREKKLAEDEERKKREIISKEEGRRNRALLATYTSEKDIEQARARALTE